MSTETSLNAGIIDSTRNLANWLQTCIYSLLRISIHNYQNKNDKQRKQVTTRTLT